MTRNMNASETSPITFQAAKNPMELFMMLNIEGQIDPGISCAAFTTESDYVVCAFSFIDLVMIIYSGETVEELDVEVVRAVRGCRS
jgi:hypothetical protein